MRKRTIIFLIALLATSSSIRSEEECTEEYRVLLAKEALGKEIVSVRPDVFENKWLDHVKNWRVTFCGEAEEWCAYVMFEKNCDISTVQPPLVPHAN